MATDDDKNTGLRVAAVGGVVLLLWLLWRGRGRGTGGGAGPDSGIGSGGGESGSRVPTAVEIWLGSGDRIELDGVASDLPTAIERARAAGKARVQMTGDTRHGWVTTVVDALRAAMVDVGLVPLPHSGGAAPAGGLPPGVPPTL